MRFNPEKDHRRSIRLRSFDYRSSGAYFVTIVSCDRDCVFGEVANGVMRLSKAGEIADALWHEIPLHFPNATPDAFVVMPNHIHGIVLLEQDPASSAPDASAQDTPRQVTARSLGALVRSYKAAVARQINQLRGTPAQPVWQRNYYEHVIRDTSSLDLIRQYIAGNPANWATDGENPERRS